MIIITNFHLSKATIDGERALQAVEDGGLVEGTLCCAPGAEYAQWWREKVLVADIKRKAVAKVRTDDDGGRVRWARSQERQGWPWA